MCLAIPGRILDVADDELRTARVAFGEVVKAASLALVPEARVGEYVLVHAGLALEVIDEAAAARVFEALEALRLSGAEG
ncbi:MAG TPA: HypC/HybG/HupF family hydrogenase formation chaperone [Holophagaceae bacterium]|nr:HypC/HybG/HupF family hydrogenase formation chaperone [Holophagaceae bacterium]